MMVQSDLTLEVLRVFLHMSFMIIMVYRYACKRELY